MKKNPINLRIKLFQFVAILVTGLIWYFSEDVEGVDYAAFPAMLVMGLAQTGLSAYQKFEAEQDMRDTTLALSTANKDLRELEYVNTLKSVSVPKNQVAMDQLGQQTTQIIDAAQESGQRGVVGAAGKVNQLFDKGTMKVSQADQMKQYERDLAVAENEQNINNMNVNKDLQLGMQNIYGLQSALGYQQGAANNATNQMYSGIGTAIAGMGQLSGGNKTMNTKTGLPAEEIDFGTAQGGQILNNQQASVLGNTNTQNVGYGMMGRGGMGSLNVMDNYNNYLMNNNLTSDQFTIDDFIMQGGLNMNNPFGTLGP